MKAKKIILGLSLAMLAVQPSVAQQGEPLGTGEYRLADEIQVWRLTQNAAGRSLDLAATDSTMQNRGIAYFDYRHKSGDFHRVQEGGMNNNLEFFTERHQKIGRYLYGYGSFLFDMGRTKDRAWSDVERTPSSSLLPGGNGGSFHPANGYSDWGNPFISGSSIPGKYDNQDFTLNAALSTVQMGHFTYGGSILYKVGDLSRLRDPRSRINLAEYRLTPAITWSSDASSHESLSEAVPSILGLTPAHTVGLALYYDRRKEKLPSLTTVQTDPTLEYYVMTGLEHATGTIGGYNGYMREYVDHEFGGELTYGYRNRSLISVTALSLAHGTEYVYGTNKYEPGRYHHNQFGLSTHNRLRSARLLHAIDLAANYSEGYADEFRQERLSETDSVTGFNSIKWNTVLTYRKRYQQKQTALDLHYRCSVVGPHSSAVGHRCSVVSGSAADAYLGLGATYAHVTDKHLLPSSELRYASLLTRLEGGTRLSSILWLEAKAGYNFSTKSDLTLADATTAYAQGVLLPDMAILGADYFTGCLRLTCQLPITIDKATRNWFVSAYADYLSAKGDLSRTQFGCTVGLYY